MRDGLVVQERKQRSEEGLPEDMGSAEGCTWVTRSAVCLPRELSPWWMIEWPGCPETEGMSCLVRSS